MPGPLHTDSIYLRDGITSWLPNWKARGWKTAAKEPVKNVDLWQRLEAAAARHEIEWRWVRGHAGHPENERPTRWRGGRLRSYAAEPERILLPQCGGRVYGHSAYRPTA